MTTATDRPTARRPQLVSRAAAGAVVLTAAVGFVALAVPLRGRRNETGFDRSLRLWLFEHLGTTWQQALLALSEPALTIGVVVVVGVLALLARRWEVVALAAVAPLLGLVLESYVLKPLVGRRYEIVVHGVLYPTVGQPGLAFPSGHETGLASATVLLAVLVLRSALSRRTKTVATIVLTAWTLLGALGLVRSLYHYATDTVGGLLLGVVVVLGTAIVIDAVVARLSSPDGRGRSRTARAA